jgi:hypothetical protein
LLLDLSCCDINGGRVDALLTLYLKCRKVPVS